MRSKIRLVVVQPTSLCNLNCSYCYVPGRKDPTKMDDSTLEQIISKVLKSPIIDDRIEFLWHAGEPLTIGLEFYKKVVKLIRKYNVSNKNVTNTIQTNGTLITDEWCKFFTKYDFGIGVSIDGPAFLHDKHRKNWANRSTHKSVMNGVKLLQKYKIEIGALCVLTRDSLDHPSEIFDFFYDAGFKWIGFNLEESENANKISSFRDGTNTVTELKEKYHNFISELYDVWRPHSKEIMIREFNDTLNIIYTKLQKPNFYRTPDEIHDLRIITIQKNGNITTNSPEFAGNYSKEYDNFIVGNILVNELEDIITNDTYIKIKNEIEKGIKNCARSCLYFDLCGGAFISNKFTENGALNSTETTTCILHRQTLSSVLIGKLSLEKDKIKT